jgi:para-aminobenzoate synthetase/4-amino-4-deoxychorismate lyase
LDFCSIILDVVGNDRVNGSRTGQAIIQIGARWLVLQNPALIVDAHTAAGVPEAIGEVERLTRDSGYYAAGFLAYEAGAAFGLPMRSDATRPLPIAWFALFEPAHAREVDVLEGEGAYELGPLTPALDQPQFDLAFARIKEHLASGDTYQANFTFPLRGSFSGDPVALFADLVRAQEGRYSAFLHTGDHAICSASPELFFALDGLGISARPMKGTARRGRTTAEDLRRRDELCGSAKERAENVMIVDMMRNDLGKIADVGSVDAPELFAAERYPNVWQMTSLVRGRTRASLEEIFRALHPPASVTGAPKRRTIEILNELEPGPRGVYTGAIGYVRPDGNGHFNVAIRTAVVSHADNHVEFGVGSGIVWDSVAAAEYSECLLKGSVLGRRPPVFDLLETTAWHPETGFMLLDRHLARMSDSAEYFGFAYSEDAVRKSLDRAVAGKPGPLRVRCLLAKAGDIRVECQPLVSWGDRPMRVALAVSPIDADDPFFFHKTTERAAYERAQVDGMDDVILWNAKNEVTEATRANVVVERADGAMVTPPIACGLLAGTARAEACERGEVREEVVPLEQLKSARRIWLTNSVHGWREAVLAW